MWVLAALLVANPRPTKREAVPSLGSKFVRRGSGVRVAAGTRKHVGTPTVQAAPLPPPWSGFVRRREKLGPTSIRQNHRRVEAPLLPLNLRARTPRGLWSRSRGSQVFQGINRRRGRREVPLLNGKLSLLPQLSGLPLVGHRSTGSDEGRSDCRSCLRNQGRPCQRSCLLLPARRGLFCNEGCLELRH